MTHEESPLSVSFVVDRDQEFVKQAELAKKAEALAASSVANRDPGSLGGLKVDIDQAAIQLAREVRLLTSTLVMYTKCVHFVWMG